MKPISLPEVLMGILAVVCVFVLLAGLRRALQRTGWTEKKQQQVFWVTTAAIVAWMVLTGILAQKGIFAQFNSIPPRPLLVVAIPLAAVIIITFSKPFQTLLLATPPHWLVQFQSFRIVVEILLWQSFIKGLLPVQMTFEGRNFDILAGILALIAGWMMYRGKAVKITGIVYNIIGLLLLINIMAVAILSMPTPFRYFTNEPANTLVARFPFIYLPGILVVLAFSLHLFSLRQLLLKHAPAAADTNNPQQHESGIAVS